MTVRKIRFSCLGILILVLFASGCQKAAPALAETEAPTITIERFVATPELSGAEADGRDYGVSIEYPVVSGLADPAIEAAINEAIYALAFSYYNEEELDNIYLDIIYDYTIVGDSLFSVQLYSQYYYRDAAHPWRAIAPLVYNLDTGKQLTIDDVLKTPKALTDRIIDGTFEPDIAWEEFDGDIGWEGILAFQSNNLGRQFYLTQSDLAIIVEVYHAIGDYRTFSASYSSIWDELTPEFQALLGNVKN